MHRFLVVPEGLASVNVVADTGPQQGAVTLLAAVADAEHHRWSNWSQLPPKQLLVARLEVGAVEVAVIGIVAIVVAAAVGLCIGFVEITLLRWQEPLAFSSAPMLPKEYHREEKSSPLALFPAAMRAFHRKEMAPLGSPSLLRVRALENHQETS